MVAVVEASLEAEPLLETEFSLANPVPSNSPTPWYTDEARLPRECPRHLVVLAIRYRDGVLGEQFVQRFYMQWARVSEGRTPPDFTHLDSKEAAELHQYFARRLPELFAENA